MASFAVIGVYTTCIPVLLEAGHHFLSIYSDQFVQVQLPWALPELQPTASRQYSRPMPNFSLVCPHQYPIATTNSITSENTNNKVP